MLPLPGDCKAVAHPSRDVQPDEESTIAARALSDVLIDQWLSRIRRVQADRDREPPEWQEVFGGSHSIVFATSAEIEEMIADIRTVLGRYDDRLRHHRRRPADGRAVELLCSPSPMWAARLRRRRRAESSAIDMSLCGSRPAAAVMTVVPPPNRAAKLPVAPPREAT